MINILRSVNYSTRKNLVIRICIFTMLCMPVFLVTVITGEKLTGMDGAKYFINYLGELFFVVIFAQLILSCIPAFSDAGDKTINYEVMAGHSRRKIFAARVSPGLFWGVIVTAFLYFIPLLYFGLLGGWYKGVSIRDVVFSLLVCLFPLFRVSAFCIMISSFFRSAGKGIGISYVVFEAATILLELVREFMGLGENAMYWTMGMLNVIEALYVGICREYIVDGEKITVFETALSPDFVMWTLISSLVFGGIYLALAYKDFKKRDRD